MSGPTNGEPPGYTTRSVHRRPHPRLAVHFPSYEGYAESATTIVRRTEVPHDRVTVIFGFHPIDVSTTGDQADAVEHSAFVAGIGERPALVTSSGTQEGIQANLSPLAAWMIFGVSLDELTNQAVDLGDLLGPCGAELLERLQQTPDWEQRFEILDAALLERLDAARQPSEAVAWAWHQLETAGGNYPIGSLADEIGWSRKHLIDRFREHIGIAPKSAARIIRFTRAVEAIRRTERPVWSDIAFDCGYYDQAHFNREFAALANCTPTEFLARQLPGNDGILDG